MLLRHSQTSPFVRKVTVLLHELGLSERVEIQTVDGWVEPPDLTAHNPMSMVPTLLTDDGAALYDSPVICEYLDSLHDGRRMIPDGPARWAVLRDQALGDAMMDSAVLIFVESHKRPAALRWDAWLALKRRAIVRSLDLLEHEAAGWGERVDLGAITLAVALAYLDLRGAVGDWRDGRPRLAAWQADFCARPSMLATRPPSA